MAKKSGSLVKTFGESGLQIQPEVLSSILLAPVQLLEASLSIDPVGSFGLNGQLATNLLLVQPGAYHSGWTGWDYLGSHFWQNIHSFARPRVWQIRYQLLQFNR